MQIINYSTLEAEVASWRTEWLGEIRNRYGEDYAEDTRQELEADPWKTLQWYVETVRRA